MSPEELERRRKQKEDLVQSVKLRTLLEEDFLGWWLCVEL